MSSTDAHKELHELFNDRDLDGVAKRTAAGFTYTDHGRNLTVRGAEEFRAWLGEWIASLDGRVTEPRYLEAGDTSIAQFVGRGTNIGPVGPFPASGREASFDLCELLTFDTDGMVTRGEIYYDQLGLLAQLGHITPPA